MIFDKTKINNSLVVIKAFNPYEARYPDRRVISREALVMMKMLREKGYIVKVEPDNNQKVEYIARKGAFDFLNDPLFINIYNIGISIFCGLISSWIFSKLRSQNFESQNHEESRIVIETDEKGKLFKYNHKGREINDGRFKDILRFLENKQAAYRESLTLIPPDPGLPYPIYLEHTEKVIGWASLKYSPKGLQVAPAKIIDNETWTRIKKGKLKGLSISGIVNKSECSVCGKDFTECNHQTGEIYDNKKCTNIIHKIDLCEISIVSDPINPEALINLEKNTGT